MSFCHPRLPAPPSGAHCRVVQAVLPLLPQEAAAHLLPLPTAIAYYALRDFTIWIAGVAATHRSDDQDPVANIPLYSDGRLVWLNDDSPTHLSPWPGPKASYRIGHPSTPGRRRWLSPLPPPAGAALLAWFCPSCGRPKQPHLELHAPHVPLVLLNAVCLVPTPGISHLTTSLTAAHSHVTVPGFPPLRGVPAAPVRPGTVCYHPDHTLLLPTTPWARTLDLATFSPLHLRRHCGLTFLTWNVGGVETQVDFVIKILVALEVDFFALQELWDFAVLLQALPPCFACFTSTAVGCSPGFMVGWLRTHQHRATCPRIEHDASNLLVATVRHHTLGFILLASVHVHPDLDYRGRCAVLVNLTTLATYLLPAMELIGGDFNMSVTDPRWLLPPACQAHGCMQCYRPALPPHTPSHFTSTNGRRSATAIDHIFLRSARSVPDADVLPSPTPHCPVLATVEPMEGPDDVRSWRLIRWRSAPEGAVSRLAALLDVLWAA